MFLALLDMDHLLLLALVPLSVRSLSLSPTFFAPPDFFSSLAYFTFSQSACNPLSAGRPFSHNYDHSPFPSSSRSLLPVILCIRLTNEPPLS
ncbi:MAG: hypothetical protein J3R72DRAFT_462312 [Linnemannia gamsii]|nr:MAG: hypothetical protein J3R72DRAFT_462312 [Linnemannia gamsii]